MEVARGGGEVGLLPPPLEQLPHDLALAVQAERNRRAAAEKAATEAAKEVARIEGEMKATTSRAQVPAALENYQKRRLVRSAAVQGLSRFASDIIIRGFDTPAKVVLDSNAALGVRFENCNYAGIVTRMLQPILPIFFAVQFNFLYDGYKNEFGLDLKSGLPLFILGVFILAVGAGAVGEGGILLGGFGLDALLSGEAFAAVSDAAASILDIGGL